MIVTPSVAAPDGFLVHSYCGDDWQECRDYIRERLGMPSFKPLTAMSTVLLATVAPIKPELPVTPPSPAPLNGKADFARKIWRESTSIIGSLAERYLNSRCLILDPDEDWHRVLRFHPACPFGQDRAPALVSLMRDIITDELRCIQRTRLTADGRKIDRQMLGPSKGAAIKIDPDANVTMGLNVGEGLESGLSGRAMGFTPALALGSAGAIAKFAPLPGIEYLRIFGERDENGANKRAALECANRWRTAGIFDVGIVWPVNGGDLNDQLRLAP